MSDNFNDVYTTKKDFEDTTWSAATTRDYDDAPGFIVPDSTRLSKDLLYPDLTKQPSDYTGGGYTEFLVWEIAQEVLSMIDIENVSQVTTWVQPLGATVTETAPHSATGSREYDPGVMHILVVGNGLARAFAVSILYEFLPDTKQGHPEVWGIAAEIDWPNGTAEHAKMIHRELQEVIPHAAYRFGTIEGGTLIQVAVDSPQLASPSPGLVCSQVSPAGSLYTNPYGLPTGDMSDPQ